MTDHYTAEVAWEDGQWQATVRDLPGAHTFAKTTTALVKRLREVIVLMDDRADSDLADEDAFTVEIVGKVTPNDKAVLTSTSTFAGESVGPCLAVATLISTSSLTVGGPRPAAALQVAADARQAASEAEAQAEHVTAVAVLIAQQAGISLRDMAMLLGLSYQRVQQIAAGARASQESAAT